MEGSNINVEEIMWKIREEIADNSKNKSGYSNGTGNTGQNLISSIDWQFVNSCFNKSEQYVNAGANNLQMLIIPRPIRWLAKIVGRAVLFLGQVITVPQRFFNRSILDMLRVSFDVFKELDLFLKGNEKRIKELHQVIEKIEIENVKQLNLFKEEIEQMLREEDKKISEVNTSMNSQLTEIKEQLFDTQRTIDDGLKEINKKVLQNEKKLSKIVLQYDKKHQSLEVEISEYKGAIRSELSNFDKDLAIGFKESNKKYKDLKTTFTEQKEETRSELSSINEALTVGFQKRDEKYQVLGNRITKYKGEMRSELSNISDALSASDKKVLSLETSSSNYLRGYNQFVLEVGRFKEKMEIQLTEKSDKASQKRIEDKLASVMGKNSHLDKELKDVHLQIDKFEEIESEHWQKISTFLDFEFNLFHEDIEFDKFYLEFENQFRGSRSEIKNRLEIYLPYLTSFNESDKNFPILDIGCGRGELLELCKENNQNAIGIDYNSMMVDECKQFDFEVYNEDALTYLKTIESDTMKAVTGIHIIEHLSLKYIKLLLNEIHRVLIPQGIVILETPNPKNLIVGACNFYTDPTHKSPIPPQTLEFYLKTSGFPNIKTVMLERESVELESAYLHEFVNSWLNISPDYGMVAWKK